jgi:cytosine/uracil/thiamine/allantoin permease
VAAPLTGVILADYLIVKRSKLDVAALYEPRSRYRYVRGVNVAAFAAVAAGVAVYSAVPHAWVKVLWGVGVGALAYLALRTVQEAALARATPEGRTAVRWAE